MTAASSFTCCILHRVGTGNSDVERAQIEKHLEGNLQVHPGTRLAPFQLHMNACVHSVFMSLLLL